MNNFKITDTKAWDIVCLHCPLIRCVMDYDGDIADCPIYRGDNAGLGPYQTLSLLGSEQDLYRFEEKTPPIDKPAFIKSFRFEREWEKIVDFFGIGGIITSNDLQEEFGFNIRKANDIIFPMKNQGRLIRLGRSGTYTHYRIMHRHAPIPGHADQPGEKAPTTTPTPKEKIGAY